MKLSKFYRLLSILLFLLFKSSNCLEYPECEQREAYLKKKFPNTLIIFVNYFSSSNDTINNAKIRYVLKQVACSIPKSFMIEYGTFSKNEYRYIKRSEVADWLEKPVEVQSCQTTFSSLLYLSNHQLNHDRVEIILHVPAIVPTEKCDYIGEFKKLPTLFHFNLIRFDNITNFGKKTMNFPNIMSINSSQPEASSELKEKAINFVNEILEIEPEILEEPPKECTDPDYEIYSISSGVISLVLVFLVTFSIYAVNFGFFRLLKKKKKVEKTVEPIPKPDKTIVPAEEKEQKFHDDDLGEISAATRKTRNFDDTYRAAGTVRKVAPKDFDESYKH